MLVADLPGFNWRKGERPYQTIATLEAFWNVVAHGKVVASQYVEERQEEGFHFSLTHDWGKYISRSTVGAARADIGAFSQSLLVELRKVSDHPHLSFDAFEGSLASGNSTSVG